MGSAAGADPEAAATAGPRAGRPKAARIASAGPADGSEGGANSLTQMLPPAAARRGRGAKRQGPQTQDVDLGMLCAWR